MTTPLQEELTDAVLRAALEPDAWDEVMRLMKQRFPSEAQTFYFLHLKPRQVQPVCLLGVEPRWRNSFDELYFTSDNPWIRLTQQLHRPGVVRTNERLEQLLGDASTLYRSSYYNEWMRPQGFKYSIGNTLFADENMVANVTLLRAPDMATFDEGEVRAFESLSRHLERSLQISVRLERAQAGPNSGATFDAFPQAIGLVDAQLHLHYANRAMESLLRARRGLALFQGSLRASLPEAQQRLLRCIWDALSSTRGDARPAAPLILKSGERAHLALHAAPVVGASGRYVRPTPMVLLMVADPQASLCVSDHDLRELYGLTASEARLTRLLTRGSALRQAAKEMGIAYGTARGYLKVLFQKMEVHSQAQLVARVMHDTTT